MTRSVVFALVCLIFLMCSVAHGGDPDGKNLTPTYNQDGRFHARLTSDDQREATLRMTADSSPPRATVSSSSANSFPKTDAPLPPLVEMATPLSLVEFPRELVEFSPYENNPVFAGQGKGHWDEKIRERGWIMLEGGLYRMWYTGYEPGGVKKLGYATSNDGLNWQRFDVNPIYDAHWVEDMMVVKHLGTYYMFAEGLNDRAQLLISEDGISWTRQGTLDIRQTDGTSIPDVPFGTPTAWVMNGIWYLLYERNGDEAIWLATSSDLKVWTNVQDAPVMRPGPDFYDRSQVAVNQIILHKGRYYIYYHGLGRTNGNWTTNVAMSTDLIHWKKYPNNPLLPVDSNKSSAILVQVGAHLRLYTMNPEVHVHFGPNDNNQPAPVTPAISSFHPTRGAVGTEVTIFGTNLSGATDVRFSGVSGVALHIDSNTQIRATVPDGATTGRISAATPQGMAESVDSFVVETAGALQMASFRPTDDSFVWKRKPTKTNGEDDTLRVRKTRKPQIAYFKFDLSGITANVVSAKLRLHVISGGNDGGSIYAVANTFAGDSMPWNEEGLNWNNAPLISGAALSSVGQVNSGATVEFDVLRAVAGNGTLSLAVKNNSSNLVEYSSKESLHPPELVLGLASGSPPAGPPTITSFTPTSGLAGMEVTISGTNLSGATAVTFAGINGTFRTVSDLELRASVPQSATTGQIRVTAPAGTATSLNDFVVVPGGGVPGLETHIFNPTDDAFVWQKKPSKTYGGGTELRVRKSRKIQIAYFKFNVSGLAGRVVSAKLRLFVLDGSSDGGSVYGADNHLKNSSTAWDEAGLNWNNAPEITDSPLNLLGAAATGETIEFDLTAAVVGDGVYTFAIKNGVTDLLKFSSKEGMVAPELEIETSIPALATAKFSQSSMFEEEFAAQSVGLPEQFSLAPNYPNPFNLETNISYALPEDSEVRVSIYNLRGQVVRHLVNELQQAGLKTVQWNGRDEFGNEVSSGVYFVRLFAGGQAFTRLSMLQK